MIHFAIGVLVGGLMIVAIWWLRARVVRRRLGYLNEALHSIQEGRYDARIYPYRQRGVAADLYMAFNEMAQHVEREFVEMTQERDILRHILQNMATGVVYLRSDGQVQMVNQAAERLFRRPWEQWQKRDHWTVFHDYHLGAAIDHALLFGNEWRNEMKIRDGLVVTVHLVPISTAARAQVRSSKSSAHDVLMLVSDVSEWRRLERMRSDFVANVSHELKTPIAAIRGFAETLLDEADEDDRMSTKFLQTIYDESLRMGNLVSDLLELSKLEAADSRIEPVSVDLREQLDAAFERLRTVSQRRQIRLLTGNAPSVAVWADPDMLLQVFLNLLANAIHYSADGKDVVVSWDVLIDRVVVHVRDHGVGIPKDSLDRVFERFYRVHRDRSRASGGTGLGLAIVKHIVTALGGEVGVQSEEGKGSDFWFTLSRLDETVPR